MSRVDPGVKLGVLAVMLREAEVLLVQRSKAPDKGLWGYPGGHVELGETVAEAAVRELREETGLVATAGAVIGAKDLILRDAAGAVTHHYYLVAVLCQHEGGASGDGSSAGTPVAGDDAAAARWVADRDVAAGALAMSDGVDGLLLAARALTARQA